jgi:predicted nuclease of predicted toxin-antitoxin system
MRLLVDANLSPKVAAGLREAGFEAMHVADLDLLTATDDQIFDRAVDDGFVVVTADSDFGMLLALRRSATPSVIHLRHIAELPPDAHLDLLVANLPAIAGDLDRGVIASMSPSRLAVRDLPLR